jgi:hypothetical protein
MRESRPPTPTPDQVTFDYGDMVIPIVGLCVPCLATSKSANSCVRVGQLNQGVAKDVEGSMIRLPSSKGMIWNRGAQIPPGGEWLAELAMMFGPDATFTDTANAPLPMFAVTQKDGTYVCAYHALWPVR